MQYWSGSSRPLSSFNQGEALNQQESWRGFRCNPKGRISSYLDQESFNGIKAAPWRSTVGAVKLEGLGGDIQLFNSWVRAKPFGIHTAPGE